MFNDEVVKIETDKLCAIVCEMRKVAFDNCAALGSKVHNGELSAAAADELFKHEFSKMFGAFSLLEMAGIISFHEYNELTDKWCSEVTKRYRDSLHCQKNI